MMLTPKPHTSQPEWTVALHTVRGVAHPSHASTSAGSWNDFFVVGS